MINKRRAIRAGAVLLAALATGHFMQSDAVAAKLTGTVDVVEKAVTNVLPEISKPVLANALPTPPREMILPTGFPDADLSSGVRVAATSTGINSNIQSDAPTPSLYEFTCNVALTATPFMDGLVQLSLDAPCYRNQRMLISHAGLEFADITDSEGSFSSVVPVFSEFSSFDVVFADGNEAKANTLGMRVHEFNRVAVSWSGGPAIHIHALEFGAEFGEAGHVWAESSEVSADGGILLQLGNPNIANPVLAEVYSFPNASAMHEGAVRVIIEAEVTPQTCETNITGKTVTVTPNEPALATAVSVTMPDCNGIDGFLVLKNLLQDMKIARN